ncbi:hypothetical protein M2145_002757 [Lachnospiraceae bacterium PF1-21]|uniref:DUF3267 domain-containing protein n=1 Tax=Ohessyouella blattaphilus TaxID=2949333 RepID=A0ABT1EKU5_9FIRM|nr:DUF3267 domain-containing protein [Ohessyouella blattaphilus]MCP1111324.1 DUF3267 domain-containing protein [Ohessyouella blattaphilus]MCR8564718.1 DUF3267 domain-containing protein [Ohessyouella blattaphilus]MDL2250266.1 DUF3267 domain-containing protein [Lachnospiraceae bacterium OttesenSCG-928-J05]
MIKLGWEYMTRKEKQEQARREKTSRYHALCSKMEADGYRAVDAIYSSERASVLGLFCAVPVAIVMGVGYWLFASGSLGNMSYEVFVFVAAFFISIPVHEVLHGVGWCIAGKVKWSHIHITIDSNMPLCHCDVPLKGTQYLVGCLFPVVVLGFIPAALSFVFSKTSVILFATLSVIIAGGDLLLSLRATKHLNDMIIDHPTQAGFVVFIK